MNFRLHTDYALRVLLYLAFVRQEKTPVDQIARAFDISRDHLFKVVQELSRLGYIHTQPGRGGGIGLARRAEDIRVSDVVADFEGRAGVLPCVSDPAVCVLEPGCALRRLLIDAERAFFEKLATTTLADLVPAATEGAPARSRGGLHNLKIHREARPS